MIWKKFNALGTEIIITASLGENKKELLEESEKITREFEERFSRFAKNSELNRFNAAPAGEFSGSVEMLDLAGEAKRLHEETGGVFDPTIVGSLEQVGYDKTFSDIGESENPPDGAVDADKISRVFLNRSKMEDLKLSKDGLFKPEGFRIDFGGIGKGYLADVLSGGIFAGAENFWISAGGDIAVKGGGNSERSYGWRIGVQNPHLPDKEIFSIHTRGEKIGVATSGVFKRKGRRGNFSWHHLIDPRSGLPVENNVLAVTAISSSSARADVFAKTVLILGERDGLDFMESREDSACIIFLKNGQTFFSRRAAGYLQ